MPVGSRQDTALITATVAGVGSVGTFEDRTGGDTDSASLTYAMGGMGPRRALGGRQEVTPVIVKRIFDDLALAQIKRLRALSGRAVMEVHEQPLDDLGNATGDPEVWRGILKRVNGPERAADGNAAAMLELEMVVDGTVS